MFNIIQNVCASIVFVTLISAIPMGILAGLPWMSVLATCAVIMVVVGRIMGGDHE
jgi:hypothetical protein